LPPTRKSLSPAKEADGLRVIYYWQAFANMKKTGSLAGSFIFLFKSREGYK
jgi:hypothetical protein